MVGAALTLFACSGCGGCGKKPEGPAAATSTVLVGRTMLPPEAGPAVERDVAMWTHAGEGTAEDLATLATHEGAAGLLEAARDEALRRTAYRAMGYARGWSQLPFLAAVAAGRGDEDAHLALDAIGQLAIRPVHAEDREDIDELREGCEALGQLARRREAPKIRRIRTISALRMLPCPPLEIPTDLDAK